jgi:hypothetical protein
MLKRGSYKTIGGMIVHIPKPIEDGTTGIGNVLGYGIVGYDAQGNRLGEPKSGLALDLSTWRSLSQRASTVEAKNEAHRLIFQALDQLAQSQEKGEVKMEIEKVRDLFQLEEKNGEE